ncbi:acyltransferase [Agromyces atrinae]|uniref:acyltransferase n=1 Tax=Agromyces atrinae TaxID=592376 RepID=UPI002413AC6F|nr:acyltransferase [Agromyces atrinae]
MNLTNLRRHFFDYARGALRGHPGVRIGRDVKLTGPGHYDLHRGATITRGVRMWVGPGARLVMSYGSKIGDRSILNVETEVIIGVGTRISWDVQILDTDFHWIRDDHGRIHAHTKRIVLEDRVLIGTGSLILKGVTVGTGAVVGAGSVVRASVPASTIVIGNPARHVGDVSEWGSARGPLPES